VACLTPPGTGAIATLAVEGPVAWTIATELFRPLAQQTPWPPAQASPGQFWLGRLGDPRDGVADEVVLAVTRPEPSPRVEIHCHGGREVVRWLQESFVARGIKMCSWQELELHTTTDDLAAQALTVLVQAPTIRTATILLDQWQGAFRTALAAIRAALARSDHAEAGRLVADLSRYGPVGGHLIDPWRVAVMGAPNVGKSSLVNALAGYQRSIVAPTPGTTRDVVTTLIAVDGWPVELADTAGIRANAPELEGQGIDRALAAARAADLCLWVMDAAAPPIWPDSALQSVRVVINKVDLPAVWDVDQSDPQITQITQRGAVRVSAVTGFGLEQLIRSLADWLVPDPPPPGAAVPFTPDWADKVEDACRNKDPGRLLGTT
jgi:tRNA modification GTPase